MIKVEVIKREGDLKYISVDYEVLEKSEFESEISSLIQALINDEKLSLAEIIADIYLSFILCGKEAEFKEICKRLINLDIDKLMKEIKEGDNEDD